VLGLLAEEPSHPFALARQLEADGELGKVLTIRRPLVYRAVDRLCADRLIAAHRVEPGDAGPERTVFRITESGRSVLRGWLARPVAHVRELRLGFLLRVVLLRRSGRDTSELVGLQLAALRPVLDALLEGSDSSDPVDLWRHHNAAAAVRFLESLAGGDDRSGDRSKDS